MSHFASCAKYNGMDLAINNFSLHKYLLNIITIKKRD